MHHAFISYSRTDADFVRRVIAILESQAVVNVWFDQDDIPCSLPWLDEVTSAIRCARFVVVFDSLAWFESTNCTLELRTAESLQVPVLNIDTEALAADQAASWITSWWGDLSGSRDERTELLERAYRWDVAERPRQMLVRGKVLKRLRNAGWRYGVPESMPYVGTFLSKSWNRQIRRRFTVAGGVAVAYIVLTHGAGVWMAILGLVDLQSEYPPLDGIESAITGHESAPSHISSSMTNLIDGRIEVNPYIALDAGSLMVQMDLNTISRQGYVGSTSFYASRRALVELGQIELPASVESAVAATPMAPAGAPLRAGAGGSDFVGAVGDAVVRVEGAAVGPDLRFSSGVSALAMSADGLLLAAAVGDTVEVRDVHSGDVWRVFRGGTARITAVRWDDPSGRILGTTDDGRTLGWAIDRAVPTMSDSDLWIMDADRNDATGDVFVLARNGTVQRMSGRNGSLQQTWQVPVGVASRIAAYDNTVLMVEAAGGTNDVRALDLGSGAVTAVGSDGCGARDVDVSAKGELALACVEGVGVASSVGAELKVSPLTDGDHVDAVVWTPSGVVAGSSRGGLWGRTQSGELNRTAGCFGAMRQLAAVPDSDVVFNAGSGFSPGCSYRYEDAAARDSTQGKVLPEADTRSSQSVAGSPDGRMIAYGFANGAVVIMDVATGDPLFTTTVEGGSVRGLAFNEDGSSVFVASRYGQFHMIDISTASKPPQELLAAVRSRVDHAVRMGLYERPAGLDEAMASAEAALSSD